MSGKKVWNLHLQEIFLVSYMQATINHWTTAPSSIQVEVLQNGDLSWAKRRSHWFLVFLNTTSCFCFWTSGYFQKAMSSSSVSSKWEKKYSIHHTTIIDDHDATRNFWTRHDLSNNQNLAGFLTVQNPKSWEIHKLITTTTPLCWATQRWIGRSYPCHAPGQLTKLWHWKITIVDRRYIFKWWIFHCHVSFPEGVAHRAKLPLVLNHNTENYV